MRNTIKKTLMSSAVALAMVSGSSANAATLNVDVDVTLPSVVILYAYTDIDLTVAADQLGPLLDTACTADDCAIDELATTGTLATLGTVDLDIGTAISPTVGANPTITIDNSWGVRGIGFTSYDESVAAAAGNEVTNLAIEDLGAPTLATQTGSVSFDIDLADPDPNSNGIVEANYTITVVGS